MNIKGEDVMNKLLMRPIDIHEDVLNIEQLENVQLSFLIFYDEAVHKYFIKSLDFSVDSEGQTLEECKINIQEAIMIHLEDCEQDTSIFDPADKKYWNLFIELKIKKEQQYIPRFSFPIQLPGQQKIIPAA